MPHIAKHIILIMLLLAITSPVLGNANATTPGSQVTSKLLISRDNYGNDSSGSTQASVSYFVDWVH